MTAVVGKSSSSVAIPPAVIANHTAFIPEAQRQASLTAHSEQCASRTEDTHRADSLPKVQCLFQCEAMERENERGEICE